MKSFLEYCKDYILDNIDDFEGNTYYACDFSSYLTEGPNIDGSLTYSTREAEEYLHEWYWDCGKYFEYEKFNFGENIHNPFENPEAYMVCMVIEGCNSILSRCPVIEDNWNEQIKFTKSVIRKIKKYVREYDNEDIF